MVKTIPNRVGLNKLTCYSYSYLPTRLDKQINNETSGDEYTVSINIKYTVSINISYYIMSKYILSDKENKLVSKAIRYVKKFVGMKYKYSIAKPSVKKDKQPFWIVNKTVPKFDYIYKRGSNCVGLLNLVRRYMSLEIYGNITGYKKEDWIGDTYAWFMYLKNKKRLEKIKPNKVYPKGTLLIQKYNPKDHGHVAMTVMSSKNGLMETKIIHNVSGKWDGKKYNSVVIEKLKDYPYHTRFTHICLPKNWLIKN